MDITGGDEMPEIAREAGDSVIRIAAKLENESQADERKEEIGRKRHARDA